MLFLFMLHATTFQISKHHFFPLQKVLSFSAFGFNFRSSGSLFGTDPSCSTPPGLGPPRPRVSFYRRRVWVRPGPRVLELPSGEGPPPPARVGCRSSGLGGFFPPGLARYGSVVIPSHTVFESFLCCDPFTHCFRVISVHRVSRQSCADRRCLFPSVERTAICLPSPG